MLWKTPPKLPSINDQLKNVSQLAHTRHRSPATFLVNLIGGLLAYTFQPQKPALHFEHDDLALLPAVI
jgi:hypothetical protein